METVNAILVVAFAAAIGLIALDAVRRSKRRLDD
jgi:hypothetical protein